LFNNVNSELVHLYSRLGHDILERKQTQGWGAKVIDQLALDLKAGYAYAVEFFVFTGKTICAQPTQGQRRSS
jgi:hypothetical protein